MTKEFSIKQRSAWFWECGISYDQILEKLRRNEISEDWLVCPFGEAENAVTIDRIDELRNRSNNYTQNAQPRPNGDAPTYVIFKCGICDSRIRVALSNLHAGDDVVFRCTCCEQRYVLRLADSDGFAILITPECVEDSSSEPNKAPRPRQVIAALRCFELPANASWNDACTAYRKMVTQYHPDKVQHLGAAIQDVATAKTKELILAYGILREFFRET